MARNWILWCVMPWDENGSWEQFRWIISFRSVSDWNTLALITRNISPVMIHRAPFGSMERFIAILIENTAGQFPLWLSPDQIAILPISEKYADYADEVFFQLQECGYPRVCGSSG